VGEDTDLECISACIPRVSDGLCL